MHRLESGAVQMNEDSITAKKKVDLIMLYYPCWDDDAMSQWVSIQMKERGKTDTHAETN